LMLSTVYVPLPMRNVASVSVQTSSYVQPFGRYNGWDSDPLLVGKQNVLEEFFVKNFMEVFYMISHYHTLNKSIQPVP